MNKRKILALLLAVVMICSMFVTPALAADDASIVPTSANAEAPKFTDLEEGHWAEDAIIRWAEEGIVEGDGDGSIQPGRNLKRAELATILTRLLGLKDKAPAETFTDVAANAWYADAVLKCAKAGIMLGDGTGKANPEATIDRQQTIVMVGRAVGVKPATGHSLERFQDGDEVADWAAPYMVALTNMNILSGLPVEDGYIVAPNQDINRASTLALLDKAIAQYVTAPGTVTVDDPNRFVVINSSAEEAGTVTVTGTTAGVVVATGTTDNVVLDKTTAGTLKVDAPVDVTVSRGSNVENLDANAAANIENNGAVTNLNTNADDVTFDGNKPTNVTTAEDVKPATDSKGNEVTEKPSSSGGSSSSTPPSTSYKYTVTVKSAVGGKVTADVTRTNEANTEVTLTVTPDAQTATSLPYVLKSLTVKNGEAEAQDITATKKFTMTEEGTYTVTAEFVRPITEAELFIVNSEETFDHLADFGYTDETTDMADLPEMQWIAVGVKRAEGFDTKITDAVLTANGADMSGKAWPGTFGKYSMAYVNENTRGEDENGAKLKLKGSAYKFVLTFTYEGASYKLECDYLKHGVTEADLHTVTFKTPTGKEIVSYQAAKDEAVTAPAAPAIDGYYFTGWDTVLTDNKYTVVEGDAKTVTITAEYVKITDQKVEVRPAGPAGAEAAFSYKDEYIKAGMTMADSTISINGATLIAYLGNAENVTNKAYLEQNVGSTNYVYFGVQVNKVDGATKVTEATKTPDFTGKTALSLGTDSVSGDGTDVLGGQLIKYFPMATDTDPVSFLGTAKPAWNRYYLWTDDAGEVKGVTHLMLNLVTEVPKLDVTFKADDKTVSTKTVDYNTAIGELPEVPAKTGYTGKWVVDDREFTDAVVITADTEVVAEYTAIEYTLKYDANKGTGNAMTDVKFTIDGVKDATAEAPAKFAACTYTKDGYTCSAWMQKAAFESGIARFDVDEPIVVADLIKLANEQNVVTLYADWEVNYVVTFDAMSDKVFALYTEDDEFSVGIPKSLDLFQKDITFVAGDEDCTFAVKGTLNAVTDPKYAGFNQAVSSEQTGYYLLFQFEAPKGTINGNIEGNIVTTATKQFGTSALDEVDSKEVFSFIWWVAKPEAENLEGKAIELTIDWDGNGEKTGTKYTLDLSGLTLKPAATTDTPDVTE